MPEVTVTFHECIQDSQEFGSTDECMVSRIWISVAVDGQEKGDYIVDLKQAVGSDFLSGEIEVGPPIEVGTHRPYSGPFNHASFAASATEYYRGLVGAQGRGIRLSRGARTQMQGNRFIARKVITFQVSGSTSGVW